MPGLRYWNGSAWVPIAPSPAMATLDSWHTVGAAGEPAFQNSWVNFGAPSNTARFRKFPDGRVRLAGGIKTGASNTVCFTLPSGYRPPASVYVPVTVSGGTAFVQVNTDGTVVIGAITGTPSTQTMLDSVEFDTESVTQYPIGPVGPPGSQPAAITLDGWHVVGAAGEPAFLNSWTNFGGYNSIAFKKDASGRVMLRGVAKTASSVGTMFTLPAGYRPPAGLLFPAWLNGAMAYISLDTSGNVLCGTAPAASVTLDQVEFDTDTVSSVPMGPQGPKGDPGPAGTAPVATIDPWHYVGGSGEPAFQNAWANFGAGYDTLAFRKMPDGTVRIKGAVKSGALGNTVFTLPPGYRPAGIVTPSANLYTTGYVASGVAVFADGRVNHQGSTNTQFFMDVSFVADDAPVTQITAVASNVQMDTWHNVGAAGEPAYQNGWVTYGSGPGAGFRKFPDGRVRLKGIISSGTVNGTMFTLPVGYRPPGGLRFTVLANSAAAYGYVDPTGAVSIASGGSNVWCDISTIEFDTESVTQVAAGAASQPIEPVHFVGAPGEPAFVNSWINYDNAAAVPGTGTQRSARFRRFPDGRVRLSGVIRNGAVNTTIFTLPAGFRPASGLSYVQAASAGYAQVSIGTDGIVTTITQSAGANVTTFMYLDGIEFDTETVQNYNVGSITAGTMYQDEGVGVLARSALNFIGSGVSLTDDPPNNRANVTVPSPIVYQVGFTGNNGAILTTWTGLKQINFTTPNYPVSAEVMWLLRINASTAAWVWHSTQVICTPAAVIQLQGTYATIASTYSGGQNYFGHVGHDVLDLLPNTAYNLNFAALAGTASQVTWDNSTAQHVSVRLFPR